MKNVARVTGNELKMSVYVNAIVIGGRKCHRSGYLNQNKYHPLEYFVA